MATKLEIVRKDADNVIIGNKSSASGKNGISIGSGSKSDGVLSTAIGANAYSPNSGDNTPSVGFAASENDIYLCSKNGDEPGKGKYTLKSLFDSTYTSGTSYTDSAVEAEKTARIKAGYLTSEAAFEKWVSGGYILAGKDASGGRTGSGTDKSPYVYNNAVAIGASADSTMDSVAIGVGASANPFAIAIGASADAGNSGITIGQQSFSGGQSAIAIGDGSKSQEQYGVSIGFCSTIKAEQAIAIGYKSTNNARGDISIGTNSESSGGVALGWNAKAYGSGATAIGNDAIASGDGTFALGNYSYAAGKDVIGMRYEPADIIFASSPTHTAGYTLQSVLDEKVNTTTKINNKPLTSDITICASDVNALPSGSDIDFNNDYSLENVLYISTTDIEVSSNISSESLDVSQNVNIGADLTVTGNIETISGQIDAPMINVSKSLYANKITFGSNGTDLAESLSSKLTNATIAGDTTYLTKKGSVLQIPKASNTDYGVVKTSIKNCPSGDYITIDTYIDTDKIKAAIPKKLSEYNNDVGFIKKDTNSIAIGTGTEVSGNNTIAIGYNAKAINDGSTALGFESYAASANTICFSQTEENVIFNSSNNNQGVGAYSLKSLFERKDGYTISDTTLTSVTPTGTYSINVEDNGIYSIKTTSDFETLYPNGINVLHSIDGTGSRAKTFMVRIDATECTTHMYVPQDNSYTIDFIGSNLSTSGSIQGISYITFLLTGINRWKVTSEQCVTSESNSVITLQTINDNEIVIGLK